MSTQPVSEGARRATEDVLKYLRLICFREENIYDGTIAAIFDRHMQEDAAKRNVEWLREIHVHPEFSGRDLDRTSESVAGLLRRYGSPLLLVHIRQMELQNWPEMFYFLARIAQALANSAAEIDRLKRKEGGEGCQ